MKVGGRQCIRTLDGHIIPLNVHNGLVYLPMEPYTPEEWTALMHVVMTGPGRWNPKALDNALTQCEDWRTVVANQDQGLYPSPFDEQGNHRFREPTPHYTIEEDTPDDISIETPVQDIDDDDSSTDSVEIHLTKTRVTSWDFKHTFDEASCLNQVYAINDTETVATEDETVFSDEDDDQSIDTPIMIVNEPRDVKGKPFNYDALRPYFLHAPREKVRKTFENTTQHAANAISGHIIQKTFKSPHPALNIWRRHEPVATDTIHGGTPAVDSGGQTYAQIFIGRKSLVIDVYGMGSDRSLSTP